MIVNLDRYDMVAMLLGTVPPITMHTELHFTFLGSVVDDEFHWNTTVLMHQNEETLWDLYQRMRLSDAERKDIKDRARNLMSLKDVGDIHGKPNN